MLKRILAVLLALVAVLAFAACKEQSELPVDSNQDGNQVVGNGEQPDNSDVSNNETDEINYEDGLSTERYDGYTFRILVRKGTLDDHAPVEEQADTVKAAVFRRNKAIEEKYGIKIVGTEASKAGYETEALNSILAGDDAYDLIYSHSRASFAYAVQGAAYNINEIEAIHLEKPWWSQDAVDSFDINGRMYILDGDITSSLTSAMVMYFNKNMFDELGFDYPYEMVLDGEWTFDEFAYLAKKGGKDLDGNGVMTPGEDRYGFYSHEWNAPINMLYAGGQKVYTKNDEGELELSLYSNKTVDVFDEFFGLMNNEACFLHITEGNINYTGNPDLFSEGRAMFQATVMKSAQEFRNMDDDFGILPYPKFDEDDEYTTTVNGEQSFCIIPITVSDVERTGAIVEALASYSAKEVTPAFYDVSLKTKHSRDEESAVMMDLIKDSIIYDIGYFCGGAFESCGRDLAKTATRDFASFYAANQSKAQSDLEAFNSDYAGIE